METKSYVIFIGACFLLISLIPLSGSSGLIDNITHYWKLDESSGDAIDELGTNNGSVDGATYEASGVIETSYSFDGTNDEVVLSTGLSSENGSISIWLYNAEASYVTYRIPIGIDQSGRNHDWTLMSRVTTGIFEWNIDDGDATSVTIYSNEASPLGAWFHVVVTWGAGGMKMWIDNVLQDDTDPFTAIPSNTPWSLGGSYTQPYWWNGSIDEVGIWSRALSASEVESLYNDGSGLAYPFVVDTCTCPGAGNNWEIDMSDYCNITEACDLTTGYLNFTGAGATRCNATITTTNLGDPGSSRILYIQDSCLINVKG